MKTLIKIKLLGLVKGTFQNKKTKQSKWRTLVMVLLFLYVVVVALGMFYMLFHSIVEPFHTMQIDWLYFALMAILVFILSFIGSVFVCEHELYEAKDNELLLSMPLTNQTILMSRLCVILLLDYIFELLIVIPALVVYLQFASLSFMQILNFFIVALTFPFLVITLTMLISWLVAMIMQKIRYKNLITVVLWIVLFGLYMYAIQSIQDYIVILIQNGQSIAQAIEKGLFPLYHLSIAIQDSNMVSLFIYLLCTFVPFALAVYILSMNFTKLSLSKGKQKKRIYKEKPMKVKGSLHALYLREVRHFFSNAMVILNGMTGMLMMIIACIAVVLYKNDMKYIIAQFAFSDSDVAAILILLSVALASMNIISASLISLEGNTLWILKSMPIRIQDIIHSKLLLHLSICLPGHIVFAVVTASVLELSLMDMIFIMVIPSLMTIFVAIFGLFMNFWKPRFDWINETVCVKQSMPVFFTMFLSIALTFIMGYGYIKILSDIMNIQIYIYFVLLMFVVLNVILYFILMNYGVKKWNVL